MASETIFAQCIMTRDLESGGAEVHAAWIPSASARVGKVLRLKFGDAWIDGWTVTEVGLKRPESFVMSRERDHLTQRKASDI